MKWATLYKLYNKFLGISIFILASISTITLTTDLTGIAIEKYYSSSLSILVIGAILLSILYIIFQIYIPTEITSFNKENYIDRYVKMNNHNIINIDYEFSILNNKKDIVKFDQIQHSKYKEKEYINPFNLEKVTKLLGDKAIVFLSELKYEYLNYKFKRTRWFLTIGFFISLLLMYYSSIIRVYTFIKGGFDA